MKDLKKIKAIWFGPSASAAEPVSNFKRDNKHGEERLVFASTGGLFIRNSKYRRIS